MYENEPGPAVIFLQAFAEFAKMKYFEADLAEDTIGAEKAISSLVSTRLPPAATKPQVTRKAN